ncbi:hypothetical protein A9Q97_00420 [Rhodospirillales bacterium 47_12_T64]|nr:hypothetical protein A9Q97_00420 [Rhodospirillales bacterium 47_12_T64]
MNELIYRLDNLIEPKSRNQVSDLLQETFNLDLSLFNKLGILTEDYRALSFLEKDRVVANVSYFPMPIMINGKAIAAAGIQSVATRPEFRGRGLFRKLMQKSLDDMGTRHSCQFLQTNQPELYHCFGFKSLEHHTFAGSLTSPFKRPVSTRQYDLQIETPEDLQLIQKLFTKRAPVSLRFGLMAHMASFVLNVLYNRQWHLSYFPDPDVMIVWDQVGEQTRLIDVVGASFPSAELIGGCLGRSRDITVCFPPDRLEGTFKSLRGITTRVQNKNGVERKKSVLMMRGTTNFSNSQIGLPPTADF